MPFKPPWDEPAYVNASMLLLGCAGDKLEATVRVGPTGSSYCDPWPPGIGTGCDVTAAIHYALETGWDLAAVERTEPSWFWWWEPPRRIFYLVRRTR